jgi:hypothetical protein
VTCPGGPVTLAAIAVNFPVLRPILAAACLLLSCCGSTPVSMTKLKRIQDTRGFMSKSLFYCGSTAEWHHFEQDRLNLFKPFPLSKGGDGVRKFKVSRSQISMPSGMEYDRADYAGQDDDQRRKVRVQSPNSATGRADVRLRKTAGERFIEQYGKFDPAHVKFVPESANRYRIEYE